MALVIAALAYGPIVGELDRREREQVIAVLERVLQLDPHHPGANHFYIHTMEPSPTPEKALASADLSVAVFAGRQLGEEAQAVTLMQGDPCQMETFLGFAARVNRKIEQNLWGSLIYNLVAIPIAMAGWLSPLVAVVAMLLSSLSVTGNTLLLIHGENRAMLGAGRWG